MSRYKELVEKKAANHAICEQIDAELKTMTPEEVFVVYYKEIHGVKPAIHFCESEAKKDCPNLQKEIVRYVLPQNNG